MTLRPYIEVDRFRVLYVQYDLERIIKLNDPHVHRMKCSLSLATNYVQVIYKAGSKKKLPGALCHYIT